MSIEACIAHAINSDLDILEALPEIQDLPLEELEQYVERYVIQVQERLYSSILEKGSRFITAKDAAGLCATCLESGIALPAHMLLKMCRTIIQLSSVDAQFVAENEEGTSLYYMKIAI
ncbi:hypothetical protein COU77_03675 [Candidatus Peregrinibacteria bacterium CG10_big_fil_rev_8_21_14_0_10_49_16]|nr:MAG: hypothetical protein COW95_00675 [Candidatus Peregrinibacteria bacterium CG22_combo_CG10-13_8_21_14_all_49_11]PIR51856.1 MAG: hypothetical protein COU77_03675 [Candidatus Peregrinibacteria bacterium CG10_big_fil_rev_8_21_14_0_10_49_16]